MVYSSKVKKIALVGILVLGAAGMTACSTPDEDCVEASSTTFSSTIVPASAVSSLPMKGPKGGGGSKSGSKSSSSTKSGTSDSKKSSKKKSSKKKKHDYDCDEEA